MTLSTTSNVQTYTGTGFVTPFPFSLYFLANAHIFCTKITISGGARTLLVENVDYTVSGAGNLTGGTVDILGTPLSTLFQLEIKRTVPVVQLDDYRAHDTFPAETFEKDLDYLTMIDQQHDSRIGYLETAISGAAISFTNLGTGVGLYSASVGSNHRFKSVKAGAGITVVDDGAGTVTVNNVSSPLTFPGTTDQFLRGDGNFTDTFQLGITSTGLKLTGSVTAPPTAHLLLTETSGTANEKVWAFRCTHSTFDFSALTDAVASPVPHLQFNRSGTAPTFAYIGGRLLVKSGDDGTTALQVVGTGTFTTPIAIGSGGTGQNTAQLAINALSAVAAAGAGQVLTKVGANASWAASGAASAPTNGTYVVITNDATLTNERALAVEAAVITLIDGGANSNVTIGLAANGVANAKLAQMPTLTIKGNNTGGTANALDLTVAQVRTMLGNANRITVSVAYAPTVTLDLTTYAAYDVIDLLIGALTGNITFNISNGFDRQIVRVRFTQDGTGSRVLTAGANLVGSVTTPSPPVLTITASKADEAAWQWNATTSKAELRSLNLGY